VIAHDTTEPARARLLHPKAELELTFARENWASIDPLDAGTLKVVHTGFVILIDKDGALAELVAATSR
jgi:hypothetical protein